MFDLVPHHYWKATASLLKKVLLLKNLQWHLYTVFSGHSYRQTRGIPQDSVWSNCSLVPAGDRRRWTTMFLSVTETSYEPLNTFYRNLQRSITGCSSANRLLFEDNTIQDGCLLQLTFKNKKKIPIILSVLGLIPKLWFVSWDWLPTYYELNQTVHNPCLKCIW